MKKIFLPGILAVLGMVAGCVAEVPNRYPGDKRYPARSYWYNDNHEYNYRHFHNLEERRYRDDDNRRGDRWDNERRDNWRQKEGRWRNRD